MQAPGNVNAKVAVSDDDLPIQPSGSGPDYIPFLGHIGIASLNLGFAGESDNAGIYHSRCDSSDHFIRFDDPGRSEPALTRADSRRRPYPHPSLRATFSRGEKKNHSGDSMPIRFDFRRAVPAHPRAARSARSSALPYPSAHTHAGVWWRCRSRHPDPVRRRR